MQVLQKQPLLSSKLCLNLQVLKTVYKITFIVSFTRWREREKNKKNKTPNQTKRNTISEKPAQIVAQISSGHRRRLLIIAELVLLLQDSIPVGGLLLLRFSHLSTVSALTLSSTNSSSICGCSERYAFTFSSVRPARQPLQSVPVLRLYKYQSSAKHICHRHFEEQLE